MPSIEVKSSLESNRGNYKCIKPEVVVASNMTSWASCTFLVPSGVSSIATWSQIDLSWSQLVPTSGRLNISGAVSGSWDCSGTPRRTTEIPGIFQGGNDYVGICSEEIRQPGVWASWDLTAGLFPRRRYLAAVFLLSSSPLHPLLHLQDSPLDHRVWDKEKNQSPIMSH